MNDGPSAEQDAYYRRGVVLGLTMGEAVLLLLFTLLLVLAVPLIQQSEKNRELQRQIARIQEERSQAEIQSAALSEIVRRLEVSLPGKGIEDITKEYVLMAQRIKSLEAKVAAIEKAAEAFRQIADAAQTGSTPDRRTEAETAKTLTAELLAGRQAMQILSEALGKNIAPGQLAQAQAEIKVVAEEAKKGKIRDLKEGDLIDRVIKGEGELQRVTLDLSNTKGQLENLRRQTADGGKGVMAVPCWATPPPEGKPEYIFDIALTTNGLIIRDRKLAHRAQQQGELPIKDVVFDTEMPPNRFLAVTRKLFDWSRERECRFFVRAFDKTSETEKLIYKRHLAYVGSHFYFFEELNEGF